MTTIAMSEAAVPIDELGEGERLSIATGEYRSGVPCVVGVHRRDGRFDIDDGGRAVDLAHRPDGWLATATALVAEEGMNINRAGSVFVQGFPGRDIAALAERLGEVSRVVYIELLSLDD